MAMDGKKEKDVKGFQVERVFESSRLADELMARAYENLIPISRRSLTPTLQGTSFLGFCGPMRKEDRPCLIGM